jgi:putative oxidoreductase
MEQNGLVTKIGNLYERFTHVLDYLRGPVLLLIRLYWGWQFFLAGKGKLGNLDQTAEFFAELSIPMPKLNAVMAASTECFGGMLLLLGLGSRLVGIPLTITMSVALLTAHREELRNMFENPDGVLTADPFLFLLASVIVVVCGPGYLSLDALIKRLFKKKEPEATSSPVSVEVTR